MPSTGSGTASSPARTEQWVAVRSVTANRVVTEMPASVNLWPVSVRGRADATYLRRRIEMSCRAGFGASPPPQPWERRDSAPTACGAVVAAPLRRGLGAPRRGGHGFGPRPRTNAFANPWPNWLGPRRFLGEGDERGGVSFELGSDRAGRRSELSSGFDGIRGGPHGCVGSTLHQCRHLCAQADHRRGLRGLLGNRVLRRAGLRGRVAPSSSQHRGAQTDTKGSQKRGRQSHGPNNAAPDGWVYPDRLFGRVQSGRNAPSHSDCTPSATCWPPTTARPDGPAEIARPNSDPGIAVSAGLSRTNTHSSAFWAS